MSPHPRPASETRGVRSRAIAVLFATSLVAGLGCRTAGPPAEPGPFRTPELVELAGIHPTLRLDIRYATDSNLVHRAVYRQARAFLQRPAAEALVRAHERLAPHGYGILVFDGYRPWSVTRLFWELTPPENRAFVAPPAKGSRHNRGCAVDCTLYDLHTGEEVPMPSAFDETTERAHSTYTGGTAAERHARGLLRGAMEAEGFRVLPHEWWHFDHVDWPRYPLLDIPFERLQPAPAPNKGMPGAASP